MQYIGELNPDLKVVRNDELTVDEALALKPDRIVVSPGPAPPPKRAFPWS
jgi:anthranilate synthase component 2